MYDFSNKVYEYVRRIPSGKVVSYGQVAAGIGCPGMSRQVGRALHRNPEFGEIPCHRVVFSDGSLTAGFAFGGIGAQASLLRDDGVEVVDNRVDMKKYRWDGE